MSGPQFFETRMGQTFYDGTMRRLADAAVRIANALEAKPNADWRQAPPLPPALAERQEAWHALIGEMVEVLHDNLTAWENEEESVQDEHADVIAATKTVLAKLAGDKES